MPVTGEEIRESFSRPIIEALDKAGLDLEFLVKQLKAELKSFTPEIIKFDGPIFPETTLPRGYKIVAQGGGKTVLEARRIDMGTRQRARIDAHKLRGDYPAEKREHTGLDGGPINAHITVEFVETDE